MTCYQDRNKTLLQQVHSTYSGTIHGKGTCPANTWIPELNNPRHPDPNVYRNTYMPVVPNDASISDAPVVPDAPISNATGTGIVDRRAKRTLIEYEERPAEGVDIPPSCKHLRKSEDA